MTSYQKDKEVSYLGLIEGGAAIVSQAFNTESSKAAAKAAVETARLMDAMVKNQATTEDTKRLISTVTTAISTFNKSLEPQCKKIEEAAGIVISQIEKIEQNDLKADSLVENIAKLISLTSSNPQVVKLVETIKKVNKGIRLVQLRVSSKQLQTTDEVVRTLCEIV